MQPRETPDPDTDEAAYDRLLRWGFGVFAVIAFFFLWQEHRAHLLGALPWLLLLVYPLMHLFIHRGQNSRGGGGKATQAKKHGEDEHGNQVLTAETKP